MPLTYLVPYLDQKLKTLHPDAWLKSACHLKYLQGSVFAQVNGFNIFPRHVPLLKGGGHEESQYNKSECKDNEETPLIWEGHGDVFNRTGDLLSNDRISCELLYLQTWDHRDVIYLDRLLRSLHVLHHLLVGRLEHLLLLTIHPRHLLSVPHGHGLVFEQLLNHLGMMPQNIILRIRVPDEPVVTSHWCQALQHFCSRGYAVMLVLPDHTVDTLNLWSQVLLSSETYSSAGPHYVALSGLALGKADIFRSMNGDLDAESLLPHWIRHARNLGMQTCLEGHFSASHRAQLWSLGIDYLACDVDESRERFHSSEPLAYSSG